MSRERGAPQGRKEKSVWFRGRIDSFFLPQLHKKTNPLSLIPNLFISLQAKQYNLEVMTALQLNAELYRAMGEIADDETLMAKVLKYVKRLVSTKKSDPTLMTKEEFFARVDEAKKGTTYRMQPNENLTTFLRRIGNDL